MDRFTFSLGKVFVLLAYLLISLALIASIKLLVPVWSSFHIAIFVALTLIALTAYLRPWEIKSNQRLYASLITLVIIIPMLITLVGEDRVVQTMCFFVGDRLDRLPNIEPGQKVTVCGYFAGCSSAIFGKDEHLWEVCRIVAPTNPALSILVYTADITINLDNQFQWTFLNNKQQGSLIVEHGKLIGKITEDACTVDAFCDLDSIPVAAVVRG